MNISTSIVQGDNWIQYFTEVLHIGPSKYCLHQGQAYELYTDEFNHLKVEKEVDNAQLIIIITSEANRVERLHEEMLNIITKNVETYERECKASNNRSD